jgi:hypothetical protein
VSGQQQNERRVPFGQQPSTRHRIREE